MNSGRSDTAICPYLGPLVTCFVHPDPQTQTTQSIDKKRNTALSRHSLVTVPLVCSQALTKNKKFKQH